MAFAFDTLERIKRTRGIRRFRWFYECVYCSYDVLHEIERCPKCYSFSFEWIKVLNEGLRRLL